MPKFTIAFIPLLNLNLFAMKDFSAKSEFEYSVQHPACKWALGMSEESVRWDGNLMPVDVGNYVPTVLTVTKVIHSR